MDLAKIRKKSLQQPHTETGEALDAFLPPLAALQQHIIPESMQFVSAPAGADVLPKESFSKPVVPIAVVPQSIVVSIPQERLSDACTPLEAILAGRNASGCTDDEHIADEVSGEVISESALEFLCFRVSDEIYGINIMDIKEIIKPREVTEVPRVPVFVSGVLSLRGTIIPVIDMRIRLGLLRDEPTGKERIIVIKNNNSLSGLLVDEVIQVVRVQQDAVEAAPTVLDGIDRDFVNGLGRADGRLIIILNLENIADINLY